MLPYGAFCKVLIGGFPIAFSILIWLILSWVQAHSRNGRKLNGNANEEKLCKQADRLRRCLSQHKNCEEKIKTEKAEVAKIRTDLC